MVLGPGGAGVSMTAAAAALGIGGARRRGGADAGVSSLGTSEADTLLITADRRSPMAGLLGVYHTPNVPVVVSTRLHLLSLDRLALLEDTWSGFTGVLAETIARSKVALPGVGALADLDAGELATLPGVEDFLLLRRIRDEAVSGRWRRIIVDGSGLGDPFEFLRSASVLSQTLNRLWPRHRRLAMAAERPVLAQLTAAVDAIDRDCVDIAELITDAHSAAIHLVVSGDDRGAVVLPHFLAAVDLMGLAMRSVIINHGTAAGVAGGQPAALRAMVAADDVEIAELPRLAEPIDRAARLRKLALALPAPNGCPLGSGAARVTEVTDAESTADHPTYELTWRQRLPEPDTLRLGRSGDDLLVTVSGFRHPVRLPSVLRRCIVTDAAWDGTEIAVRFVPDPTLWPQRR